MVQDLLDDDSATAPDAFQIGLPSDVVPAVRGEVTYVPQVRQMLLGVSGQGQRWLIECDGYQVREVEIVAGTIFDLLSNLPLLKRLDDSNLDQAPHHNRARVVPARSKRSIHLATNRNELAALRLDQDRKREEILILLSTNRGGAPGSRCNLPRCAKRKDQLTMRCQPFIRSCFRGEHRLN